MIARPSIPGVYRSGAPQPGACPHGVNARQFAWQVRYGQTPMQAIQSATINAATLLGHEKDFGSLRPGKRADIIAVRGDPLADVRMLEHVRFVMKDGTVDRDER